MAENNNSRYASDREIINAILQQGGYEGIDSQSGIILRQKQVDIPDDEVAQKIISELAENISTLKVLIEEVNQYHGFKTFESIARSIVVLSSNLYIKSKRLELFKPGVRR